MNKGVHTSKPCCGGELAIAGVAPADFGALDALAVKLISLDVAFASPLRELGTVLGARIAATHERRSLSSALDGLIAARRA